MRGSAATRGRIIPVRPGVRQAAREDERRLHGVLATCADRLIIQSRPLSTESDAMKKILSLISLSLLLALAVAACSSTGKQMSTAERLAFYEAHAGEPVNSFRMWGSLNGWTPLGTNNLVVWTRPNEAFLLDVTTCPDLPFATAITLSNFSSTVTARFDTITPVGPGTNQMGRVPCRITQIRPIDVKALNQSREELRQANTEARAEETPATDNPTN